jgi:hypothetical protein
MSSKRKDKTLKAKPEKLKLKRDFVIAQLKALAEENDDDCEPRPEDLPKMSDAELIEEYCLSGQFEQDFSGRLEQDIDPELA